MDMDALYNLGYSKDVRGFAVRCLVTCCAKSSPFQMTMNNQTALRP